MYQSRLHAYNDLVSIALDAQNAELLELCNLATGDNYIKSNCHPQAFSPFMLEIPVPGGMRHLYPPRYAQIRQDPSLKPEIQVEQKTQEAQVHIFYPAVVELPEGSQEKNYIRHSIQVTVDILLPRADERTQWRIQVVNQTDDEIQRVLFPLINGVFLGDTWEDDEIVLPRDAGLRVKNPVKRLSEKTQTIHWKWQEYRYAYGLNGPCGIQDDRGSYVYENNYSGGASMLWMDLFDEQENSGLYITCRNDLLLLKAIRAETFGESEVGMGLSIVHFPCLQKGQCWQSECCILGIHTGDWHWAADDYRAWRTSLPRRDLRPHRPRWFEESPGLVAHYDFKYQGQGVVHRFRDIPALLEQAREMGMNHLLCSGWNVDGFDHGFPQYRPDPELGTEEELRTAVQTVRKMGGHLAFYINSRLCNTKYPDRAPLIQESAIMRRDGSLHIEKYGADDLEFACLCNGSKPWRDEFVGVVDYLTHQIGADSMYLDQLAMAPGTLCYHPGHTEHAGNPAAWNQGYEKMLQAMRNGYENGGMAMLYEGCSDIHGWGVSGQLISTMFSHYAGAYPELYKYTFPDEILVDMMNPCRNSGMRAAHIARKSTFLLYRAFVTGSYFWVYDLEMDNTFRRDDVQYDRLKKVIALRTAWLRHYGHGTFRDTRGILACTVGMLAKMYKINGGMLIACAWEHPVSPAAAIDVEWTLPHAPQVTCRTWLHPDQETPLSHELREENGKCILRLHPQEELTIIRIQ